MNSQIDPHAYCKAAKKYHGEFACVDVKMPTPNKKTGELHNEPRQ